MEQVEAFIEDGGANAENFFVDEDEAVGPGLAAISVGGRFTFVLDLSSLKISTKDTRSAVRSFVEAINKNAYRDIKQVLTQSTREASKVAEDGDAGACDEFVEKDFEFDVKKVANTDKTEFDRLFDKEREKFEGCSGSKQAIDRLLADYQRIFASKLHTGWTASPQGNNLFTWTVTLTGFEKGTPLFKDMEQYKKQTGRDGIDMVMEFPQEYPFKPPFIRVIRPRFVARTGHVTIGGSICTELLVDEGWKPINDIESILTTIHCTITDNESGGRIDFSNSSDYTLGEAQEAFHRVAAYHRQNGW